MNIDLYQQLVQWRNKKAAESGKVAYMILSNLTLQMTVESMPTSLEELEKVKGWGPAKIAKYGRDILLLLQGNQDSLNFDPTRTEMVEPAPETKDLGVKAYIETLNSYLSEFGTKTIVGEVIDIHTRNNYAFFTLKDSEDGEFSMSCFLGWMFYDKFFHLLEEGTQIKIKATPKVYKNGRLSVDVNHIEALGEGALKIAFEKLKKELQAQGYFDQNRKTIITQPIQTIGIITSAKSAAIKDFLNNLENQGLKIILKDVYVEGDHAVSSITQALKNFAPYADKLDAIVLTRGGGSLESLKAFNDRQIADTIFTHPVPIICGVGHERDESIADYVADIRCSTPTAIASHINNHNRKFVQKADDAAHALSQYVQGAITSQQHLLWGHYTRLNHTYAQYH
jgi:exodeoxyribonuclease VII large subunit